LPHVKNVFTLLVDDVAASVYQKPLLVDWPATVIRHYRSLLGLDTRRRVMRCLEILEVSKDRKRIKVESFKEERCW